MAWVDFQDEGHIYSVEGKVIPSVTQVLAPLYDWSGIPELVLTAAKERGTAVHKACELYALEILDESSLEEDIAAYLQGYKKFLADTGFKPERVETTIYSPECGYAGTCDLTGRMRRKNVLIDVKSGVVSPVTGPQTAAYAKAITDAHGDKFTGRYGLYLRPNDYRLVPYTCTTDWLVFRAALTLSNWRKNNGV